MSEIVVPRPSDPNQIPVVEAPPKPEIAIRTMDSDIKAIESGGGDIIPAMQAPEVNDSKFGVSLDMPGYTGPEQGIFAQDATVPVQKGGLFWKILILVISALALVALFGSVAYYFTSRFVFTQ